MAVSDAESSDEVLAAQAAGGDGRAFETLVVRYQSRVFRLACRLTSEADAPDVLQETFLQVHRHLAEFRGASKFGTWLYRIATNACLMHRRAASRRPSEPLDAFLPRFDGLGGHAGTPDELRVVTRIDELIDQATLAGKARDAIARLPDLYREAFVLRDLEGLSTTEVAETLGLDAAAVRQRVHRARLMLRGFLTDLAGVKP
ncbi:MAG: sigma-70 family RNA polymerase sigma factor [Acidobacteria bacterium]|nr:MAG: sigma-70 family RNA polymerase sigma factor [Acidobacteriota bacterium]